MMSKKNLKTIGVVGTALALALSAAVAVPLSKKDAKANLSKTSVEANTETEENVFEKELKTDLFSDNVNYNILATITTKDLDYSDVKDSIAVLYYNSNNAVSGYNKMDMNVVEYESDGVTPKTVNFSSEFATVETSHSPYVIYCIPQEKEESIGDFNFTTAEEVSKCILGSGTYRARFEDTEKPNPVETYVTLSSQEYDPATIKDIYYSELTYSVNGGEEKTVYAHKTVNMRPTIGTLQSNVFKADVLAAPGDTVEYSIKIPAKDGTFTEKTIATVVK